VNRLASETSPYLRQHAQNPVDWFAWSDEAFARARELDRPIMLSIGYSSCHWCHVMAHESFEDPEIAAVLNDNFVSVKVDREERPDVDAIYMEAVQAVSGRGGWPMTVFLTPDARPFFAGTYFPKHDMAGTPSFHRLLSAVEDAWRNRRNDVEQQADALLAAISASSRIEDEDVDVATSVATPSPTNPAATPASPGVPLSFAGPTSAGVAAAYSRAIALAIEQLRQRFDRRWGGFGPAPKFPHPNFVELCLQHHRLSEDPTSLEMAALTLKAMAAGGIYDHLGGGFARYSTDETWTVPHFEKMLYDQAGLVRTYLHAWQVTADPQWLGVVEETIAYVLRDLMLGPGGVCSAEDADSEGEEGRFYVWTPQEIVDVLGAEQAPSVMDFYEVSEVGNFEGRSILRRPLDRDLRRPPQVERAREMLFDRRGQRVRPGLDDKVLTEWNAMFGAALAEAAAVTGRDDWGRAATRLAEFLLSELRRKSDGRWLRSWQDGRARHLAYAADHAWLVEFFCRLAELTGRSGWLEHATETATSMLDLFSGNSSVLFTTGSDAEQLIVRPAELADGATPSATSVAARALIRLGALSGEQSFSDRGESLLQGLLRFARTQPLALANAVSVSSMAEGGVTELVIGGERQDLLTAARARYEPNQVIAWGEPTSSPLWEGRRDAVAYVCRNYTCQSPSDSVDDLVDRLDAERADERASYAAAVAVAS
jgi:uncharacterized protein